MMMHGMAFRRNASVMVREIDGETLLLDLQRNLIHQLNRTASVIWHLCEANSPPVIASALAAEFEIDEAAALADVEKTLRSLEALRLIAEA